MDLSYNPHAERTRRKNRSSTNVNHLTLAPLTTKIPFNDDDAAAILDSTSHQTPVQRSTSYLQGKSAPTTPRLLSHSPAGPRSRSHHRTPSAPGGPVSKSKSTTHISGPNGRKNGTSTPKRRGKDEALDPRGRGDSDWLLRTGALMSTEAREFKGQAWLVSRQSSTSLAAMQDEDEEAFEKELAHERELASHRASRRGSSALADDDATSANGSRFASRFASRANSVAEFRSNLLSPMGEGDGSYFPPHEGISGPDFVNLDEKLEELERDTSQDDEAAVRWLMRYGQGGGGSWLASMLGWSLFSVDEYDEDEDDGEDESIEDAASQATGRSGWSSRHFEGISNVPDEKMPPPRKDEGAWGDAAWLLSVASKVMF
ncbi:hypothetical protein ACO1O0_007455 [Amphichorda felina]